MPRHVLKLPNDRYMEWSTVVDAPVTRAVPLDEFRDYYLDEYGSSREEYLLKCLARAEADGCSAEGISLATLISCNRAGPQGSELSLDEIMKIYSE